MLAPADAPTDAPPELLLTSDAILAALPVTPQLTAAAPTTEPPALPLLDDVASAAAAAAPLDEDEGAPAAMPPPPPRRNYPPVELDLSDSTAAASPALLPTTHSTVAVDSWRRNLALVEGGMMRRRSYSTAYSWEGAEGVYPDHRARWVARNI